MWIKIGNIVEIIISIITFGYGEQLALFIAKKLFNTNPTYNSYFFLKGLDKKIKDNYLFLIWKIRKFLIKRKIHKPYNW